MGLGVLGVAKLEMIMTMSMTMSNYRVFALRIWCLCLGLSNQNLNRVCPHFWMEGRMWLYEEISNASNKTSGTMTISHLHHQHQHQHHA